MRRWLFGLVAAVVPFPPFASLEIIDNETILWDGKEMVLCPPNPDEEERD